MCLPCLKFIADYRTGFNQNRFIRMACDEVILITGRCSDVWRAWPWTNKADFCIYLDNLDQFVQGRTINVAIDRMVLALPPMLLVLPVLCSSDCGGGWWLFREGDIMWNTNACHGYNSIQSRLAYASWPFVLLKTAPELGCLLLSWSLLFIQPKSDTDATLNMFNWRMWDYEGSLYDKINTFPNLIRRLCLSTTRKIGISRDVISLFADG